MKIDINKKYRTRDGREAIVHATDGPRHGFPVIASVASPDSTGGWIARDFSETGRHLCKDTDGLDLIEVREPREWKAVVMKECGTLTNYDEGDEYLERFEVVRVREILD